MKINVYRTCHSLTPLNKSGIAMTEKEIKMIDKTPNVICEIAFKLKTLLCLMKIHINWILHVRMVTS